MGIKKRGQSSVEILVLLAVGLAVVLAVVVANNNAVSSVSSQLNAERAKSAVNYIANTAELVYRQGTGAKSRIFVSLPSGIESVNISSNAVELLMSQEGKRGVYRTFSFNVSGNISSGEGSYWVAIEAKSNHVSISS